MAFTPAQQSAIDAANSELLVSAAAGSGKTAVLVERIYALVQQRGYQIDRMLVVTFTNAAAAEMRERLETRFQEESGYSDVLRRQADRVESAQISTLHAFCQKLVREFFEIAAIDPMATLCDDMMKSQLLTRALEETLSLLYERALEDENLSALTRKFTQREIEGMLLSLHGFLMSLPHPFAWLKAHTERHYSEEDLSRGAMAETLLADCRILLEGARAAWERALSLVQNPHCKERYGDMVREDGLALNRLYEASFSLLALLKASVENSFGKMPGYRLKEPAEIHIRDQLKELREQYKKRVEDIKTHLPADASQGIRDMEAMMPALRGLAQAVRWLHERYGERKASRNVIDFSDLEHMALSILSHPRIQARVSRRFDAVFVDEYQDISEIQEAILNAIKPSSEADLVFRGMEPLPEGESPENKVSVGLPRSFFCFYVGDVKQSIYRFRQADPTLFMTKQRLFSTDSAAKQRKISLSHNFRSRESILTAVNRVFSHVMREAVTEIDYDADAMLYPGLPSAGDIPPRLHLMERQSKKAADQFREEAKIIAKEINDLAGQPLLDRDGTERGILHYRDMVILLPRARGVIDGVEQTLTDAGIPVYCEDQKSGMESPEIRQALIHLRLLDNMLDDVSFLASLRGPHYAFTEEELAQVRLHKTESTSSYLEAFMAAADAKPENALSVRCQQVLLDFKQERFLQQSMPLDEYLWDFLSRSGLYGFYGTQPGGKLRQANLRMLCTQANEHVARHGGDLHGFLQTIGNRETLREGSSPVLLSPWENVVRIMTIHKSKGLEFPVVFVMGLGGGFSRRGDTGILSTHSKLGVAIRYVNEKTRTQRKTLLGSAVTLRTRMEDKSERARLLYVAMTRPRDRLIMIGSSSLTPQLFVEKQNALYGEAYAVWEAKSMLEWIGQTIQNHDEIRVSEDGCLSTEGLWTTSSPEHLSIESTFFPQKRDAWQVVFHINSEKSSLTEPMKVTPAEKTLQGANAQENRLQALLESLRHIPISEGSKANLPPRAHSSHYSNVPLKIGVTALCRNWEEAEKAFQADPEAEAESAATKRLPLSFTGPRQLSDLPPLPSYLRGDEPQAALLKGIATHKILSLISYPLIQQTMNASRSPSDRSHSLRSILTESVSLLSAKGLLSKEESSLAQVTPLMKFFGSPLGKRALFAKEVHREWRFNFLAPDLCESILQGVIDLCFLEDGSWVLVDFKTDQVSSPQDLHFLYARQVEIYRRALVAGTGLPVKESILFSLNLGEGFQV